MPAGLGSGSLLVPADRRCCSVQGEGLALSGDAEERFAPYFSRLVKMSSDLDRCATYMRVQGPSEILKTGLTLKSVCLAPTVSLHLVERKLICFIAVDVKAQFLVNNSCAKWLRFVGSRLNIIPKIASEALLYYILASIFT